ncbi:MULTISPECIES: hypothetical protein [unclassified Butyrivibrio]|uniref:hypothetical protein n=1 Tax=unclassified Butyrivibrio TaxID=2639466 RepID=UPI00042555FD|nr:MULTISPECIES: hypothetical protein [unclassified Butyrivibrio]
MAHNTRNICMNCGRLFTARESNHAFCSLECKRMYSNHSGYRCRDCRNAGCKVRNNSLVNSPPDCENLQLHKSYKASPPK